jgi:hypothetical protein
MQRNLSQAPFPTGAERDDMAMLEDIICQNCRMTEPNEACLATTHRNREPVMGRRCYETSPGHDERCGKQGETSVFKEISETGRPRSCHKQHLHTQGSEVWMDLLFSPSKDKKGGVT